MNRTYIKYLILLFLLVLTGNNLGQNKYISGLILSKETDDPIPFVNISFPDGNKGAVSNKEGYFKINFTSKNVLLRFSCIGFNDTVITFNSSQDDLRIYLEEISYELSEIVVDPYTFAERFMLEAIKANQIQRSQLKYYINDSYSKETFRAAIKDSNLVVGIMEAVSKSLFLSPNKYQENILAVSKSSNMKAVPFSAFIPNHKIDLQNEYVDIANFSLISPLNQNALIYYDYSLLKELTHSGNKTTIINVMPKKEDTPLFMGTLTFNNSYKLIEADLDGSDNTKDEIFDSLTVSQKFTQFENKYNLPYITSFSIKVNFGIFPFTFSKETGNTNFSINDPQNKPVITSDKFINYKLNSDIDLELLRNNLFKIPLTLEEKSFNQKIIANFVNGAWYKKLFLFMFTDGLSILTDQPVSLSFLDISKFSNIYRFNKVEGHFLGFEKEFNFNDDIKNYTNVGYAFGSKLLHFKNDFIWNYFRLEAIQEIKTLGEFNKYKTLQTLNGLFLHADNYNYYKRKLINFAIRIPFSNNFELFSSLNLEKNDGIANKTDFSFFYPDISFKQNYKISPYNSNFISMGFTYSTDQNYHTNLLWNLKGKSTFLISANIRYFDHDLLNASETFWGGEIYSKFYWELFSDIRLNTSLVYFNQRKSTHISEYRFTNEYLYLGLEDLGISELNKIVQTYTLRDYQYTLSKYLYLQSKMFWFKLPEVFNLNPSFTTIFTFLKSYSIPNKSIHDILTKTFYEYGIGIEGISVLNLYLVTNNFSKKFYLRFGFML